MDGKNLTSITIEGHPNTGWFLIIRSLSYLSTRPLKSDEGMILNKQAAQTMAEEVLDRDFPEWRKSTAS